MDERWDRFSQVVAWIAIIVSVALAIAATVKPDVKPKASGTARQQVLQVQLAVGMYEIIGRTPEAGSQWMQGLAVDGSTPAGAAALAIAAGELEGSSAALEYLEPFSAGETQAERDLVLLKGVYDGSGMFDAAALSRTWGWLGELAAVHNRPPGDAEREVVLDSARRIAGIYAVVCVFGVMLLILGCVLAGIAIQRWRQRTLVAAPRPPEGNGALLVAFACYLLSFSGFGMVLHFAVRSAPISMMWLYVPVLGLVVLGVSRFGGRSWPELRDAMGLHRGHGVVREAGAGLIGYLAGLPLLGLGIVISAWLSRWFPVDHPLTQEIMSKAATPLGALAMVSVAAGFAPLVEEITFRGLLLQHLQRYGTIIAVVASSLIFAALHPQGVAGIPVIASLGAVFALIRVWRGSLIASMTAHALHNGTLVIVLLVLMR